MFEQQTAQAKQLAEKQQQHESELNKLTQQAQLAIAKTQKIQQHLADTQITNTKHTQQLQQQVQTLQDAQQFTKDQVAIAHDILQKHLESPLEQGIPELDITTLKSLLHEGHLNFQDALKTKALIAEHQQQGVSSVYHAASCKQLANR